MKKVKIKLLPTDNKKQFSKTINQEGEKTLTVGNTLQPVDEEDSNLEAEVAEQVVTNLNFDGIPENYTVGGKRHYNGGTPLNLPNNSFVFSRDKKMRISNSDILKMFGKKSRKAATPADLAKKYKLNDYKKVLLDKDADDLEKSTAELMIANYNEKLGKLSLVQESMKGFPTGLPSIAMPYIISSGFNPEDVFSTEGQEDESYDMDQAKWGGQKKNKVRILKNPSYQPGGGTFDIYPEEFLKNYLNKYQGQDTSGAFPSYLRDEKGRAEAMKVAKIQKSRGKNIAGKYPFDSPEMMTDFATRQNWYLKQNPDFDPHKASDVKDFQDKYNQRLKELGLGSYDFKGTQFGQLTHGAPNLDYVAQEVKKQGITVPTKEVGKPLPDLKGKPLVEPKQDPEYTPYWMQDIIKTAGAFGDMSRIKKYLPWQAPLTADFAEPTYYDPTRELAANAEQSAIASNALSAFTGPQGASARFLAVQGQGAKNAADILGKYNNLNVGVANEFERENTGILNNLNLNKAKMNTELYDKTVIANQQFDNAKAMARQNLRQSFIDAFTNRGMTQGVNTMYSKQFKVDPTTGFVTPTGKKKDIYAASRERDDIISTISDIKSRMPGISDELAYKIAMGSGTGDEGDLAAETAALTRAYPGFTPNLAYKIAKGK